MLKFGVIGTGAIGTDHTRRLMQMTKGAEVVALQDINHDIMKEASTYAPNAKLYTSDIDLINDPNVQAVLVTSPGKFHASTVVAAIKAGKYIFCEKPLATTAADCDTIVKAEMAGGKRLVQVGYQRRYDNGYLALKQALDDNLIGEPLMVKCVHRNPFKPSDYTTDMHIHDTFIHEIDALHWLLKEEYAEVEVMFPKSAGKEPLRDPQIVILKTKSGVIITAEVFVNCNYGYDIQCEIVGTKGTISLPENHSISFRSKGISGINILQDWKERFIDAYDIELQDFVDSILAKGAPQGPSSWDGYVATVTSDAAIKSQTTGQREKIDIGEKPNFYN